MQDVKKKAHENGYVTSIFGRKCSIENINHPNYVLRSAAERAAINAPIQATASDIVRLAMIKIQKLLDEKQLECKLLLQIHDELIFECQEDKIDQLSHLLKQEMENATILSIPLRVNLSHNQHW